MSEDILNIICKGIIRWVNHSKEGYPRQEKDLIYFDRLWNSISDLINSLEKQRDPLDEEEKDIVKMLKYEGKLYRIHKKYNRKDKHYGVLETDHYVSWTKTDNFSDLYWLYNNSEFITITAMTNPELFAIDLIGFNNYIKKYYYPNYSIGSPAIFREQEVVFPINFSTIQDISIKKWID